MQSSFNVILSRKRNEPIVIYFKIILYKKIANLQKHTWFIEVDTKMQPRVLMCSAGKIYFLNEHLLGLYLQMQNYPRHSWCWKDIFIKKKNINIREDPTNSKSSREH